MRSGSSMTARALHLSKEVHMGDDLLLGGGINQPRGHYENKNFLRFNEEVLKSLGCSWSHPPTREMVKSIRGKYDMKIKQMIEESVVDAKKAGFESWGWKDPRTIMLIDLYTPHLNDPKFICCYRKPIEVAESLFRRDKTPIKRGLEIANIYNERLHEFMSEWLELNKS